MDEANTLEKNVMLKFTPLEFETPKGRREFYGGGAG